MDGDRNGSAMARIDAALARIEAAGRTVRAPGGDDGELAQRHAALRDAVAQSLRDLDALIGDQA